ncbi:MAG: hypothetical protein AAF959_19720 [Cyanobacteria bacterium P01_D01_bin.56]
MPAYQIHHSQPFPQSLHDAFQSLSLRWVQKNKKLRHPSILRMVDAARQSVEAVEPEFKELVDFADQPLIERMTYPSEECEAWASEYSLNFERDQNQSYIPRLMVTIKQLNLPDVTYAHFRRFIAENPFPTDADLAIFRHQHPDIESVYDLLMEAYRKPPIQSQSVPLCKTCGGYLDCAARDIKGYCEELSGQVTRVPIEDTVICLIRPSFIELRLFEALEALGLRVELWPSLDKADISLKFPNGDIWAVDAKDWGSAAKLAIDLNHDDIPYIGQSKSFFVVPDYRWNDIAYQSALNAKYNGTIPILSESKLIRRVENNLI